MSSVLCFIFASLIVVVCSVDARALFEDDQNLQTKNQNSVPVAEFVHNRSKRTIKTTAKIIGAVGAAKANLAKFALLKMGLKAAIAKISAGLAAVGKIGKVGLGLAAGVAAAKVLGYAVSNKFGSFQTEAEIHTNTWSSNNVRRR